MKPANDCSAQGTSIFARALYHRADLSDLENRYVYHPPKNDQASRYAEIRSKVLEVAKLVVSLTPRSPEQEKALDALDMAMFYSNASIARHE